MRTQELKKSLIGALLLGMALMTTGCLDEGDFGPEAYEQTNSSGMTEAEEDALISDVIQTQTYSVDYNY